MKTTDKTRHRSPSSESRSSSPEDRRRYQRVVLLPGERLENDQQPPLDRSSPGRTINAAAGDGVGSGSLVAKVPGFVVTKAPKEGKEDGEVTTEDEEGQEEDAVYRHHPEEEAALPVESGGETTAASPGKKTLVPVPATSRQEAVEEEKLQKRLRNLERQKREQFDLTRRRHTEDWGSARKDVEDTALGVVIPAVADAKAAAADSETDLEKELEDLEQKQQESSSWLRAEIEELRRELNDLKSMVKSMAASKRSSSGKNAREEDNSSKTLTALDIISREVRTTLIAKHLYEETTETTLMRWVRLNPGFNRRNSPFD